jgi:pimeloyl-ACP methyl ester carboxylesterase
VAAVTSAFTQHEVELRGGSLQYRAGGRGRPILYLHGAGGPNLSPSLEELAASFRIYQPTLPGFDGRPPFAGVDTMQDLSAVVSEFAERVIGETADVIGHSFGGWLAAWLAVLHPERVGQLVLETAAGFRPEGLGGIRGVSPEELLRRGYVYPERAPRQRTPEMAARNRALVEHYHGPVATDRELVSRLNEIQCLTLLIQGTEDGLIPPESGRLLKKHIPRSYLTYVFDAAHGIEFDQPERFAALVKEFLERGEAFIINWKDQPPRD